MSSDLLVSYSLLLFLHTIYVDSKKKRYELEYHKEITLYYCLLFLIVIEIMTSESCDEKAT